MSTKPPFYPQVNKKANAATSARKARNAARRSRNPNVNLEDYNEDFCIGVVKGIVQGQTIYVECLSGCHVKKFVLCHLRQGHAHMSSIKRGSSLVIMSIHDSNVIKVDSEAQVYNGEIMAIINNVESDMKTRSEPAKA